jgi:ribonuclease P protein component
MPTAVPAAPVDQARPPLWRITDRRTFVMLREHGRRARHGVISVTYLGPAADAAAEPPRAAYAISKAAGGAVVRNRIKRRLRAALRELQATGELPRGTYLVTARTEAARTPWSGLVSDLRDAIAEATR